MPAETIVQDADLVIRRMRDDNADYQLIVRWRNMPHVRRWWDPDRPTTTIDSAIDEYRADARGTTPSTVCIIERSGEPLGLIQFYRWVSYADEAADVGITFDDQTWGLDVFIGEADQIHRGIGTRVVNMLSDYLVEELGASSVALTTDVLNHAAQRCYEKAGFEKVKQVLDTDTYQGERVLSWLMVREPPSTVIGPSGAPRSRGETGRDEFGLRPAHDP